MPHRLNVEARPWVGPRNGKQRKRVPLRGTDGRAVDLGVGAGFELIAAARGIGMVAKAEWGDEGGR